MMSFRKKARIRQMLPKAMDILCVRKHRLLARTEDVDVGNQKIGRKFL